jgi:hypothetical protein
MRNITKGIPFKLVVAALGITKNTSIILLSNYFPKQFSIKFIYFLHNLIYYINDLNKMQILF